MPPPKGEADAKLRALIFDSSYDQYRGVVSSIRIVDGTLAAGARLRFMQANAVHDIEEVGVRTPVGVPVEKLGPGEVGYLIAGIKDVGEARSGETVTTASHGATEALEGYKDPKPMVFCGIYPVDGDQFAELAFLTHDLGVEQRGGTDDVRRGHHFAADGEFVAMVILQLAKQVRAEADLDASGAGDL